MPRRYDYCGIYKIQNTINGKIYIGQSKHIYTRWTEHKKELKAHRHKNIYLQRAWDKYGISCFIHEIIELCDEDQLDERECYYINLYETFNSDKGYNLTSGGGRNKQISDETKEKIRINSTGTNNPNCKKIISLENKQIYDSIVIAANECNTHAAMIYRCCTFQRYTAGGYHWLYYSDYLDKDESFINDLLSKKDPGKTRKVIYLNTLEIFDSIQEASKKTGINAKSISSCCLHNRKQAGKTEDGIPRIFMYYTEYIEKVS